MPSSPHHAAYSHTPGFRDRLGALPVFWLLALLLNWPLLGNPGYFSHDELSWAALADVAHWRDLPWLSWADLQAFQYRPLTFNLWLLLAHALHATPWLFHALWVLFGLIVATLLRQTLHRAGLSPLIAGVAALLFALNPYAVYVHGWVATLADLIWVGIGVALACWLSGDAARAAPAWRLCLTGVLAGVIALSAKEAALVLAPLAWLAVWLLQQRRDALWLALGLTLPAMLYLALRLDVILYQPRVDQAYAWSLATVPVSWAAYHLYTLLPTVAEVSGTWLSSTSRLLLAGALWLAFAVALHRAGWRFCVAALLGVTLALGPVLILQVPYNQYAYGASALLVGIAALAWPRLAALPRAALVVVALLSTWHGVNTQRLIHRVGDLQSRFTPSLSAAVAARPGQLTLSVEREGDAWIYARLAHDPLAYGSTTPRVRLITGPGGDLHAAYNGEVLAAARDVPDRPAP